MFTRNQAIMLASALTLAIPIAVGVASVSMMRPAIAQEQVVNTLTVSGQGMESVQTTITQVRLGVEADGDTAEAVQEEVARRSNAVVELLRSRNVSQLQTTGISLSPRYDYSGDTRRLVGYQGSNMVSFEVPTEAAGELLDDAVRAGASRIDGVNFIASDEAIAAAREVALQEASQDALAQADAVLSSLGLTRRNIISIQVGNATPPPPVTLRSAEAFAADAAPTPVVGGEQEIRASVTLQISY
jgi:uncharacterized protein YggE